MLRAASLQCPMRIQSMDTCTVRMCDEEVTMHAVMQAVDMAAPSPKSITPFLSNLSILHAWLHTYWPLYN